MQDVVAEFEELLLPDERLNGRVRSFVEAAWRAPSESFPRMLQDAAHLEGGYRLLNNARVTFDSLRAPHVGRTVERARSAAEVVVVHDTTEIETAYAEPSEVGYLKTGRTGYQAHISLAVSLEADGPPKPLGVLCVEANFHLQPPNPTGRRKSKSGWATARSKDKAFLRWERGIEYPVHSAV